MRNWSKMDSFRIAFITCLVAGAAGLGAISGCDQQAKVKQTEEVSTPEGRTRVTDERTVEKSGDHKDHNTSAPYVTPR